MDIYLRSIIGIARRIVMVENAEIIPTSDFIVTRTQNSSTLPLEYL